MRFWTYFFGLSILFFSLTTANSQQLKGGVTLTIMPLALDIKPPQVGDNVIVLNGSEMPIRLQVRIFRWQQRNGKDYYAPTKEVIVNPPFIEVQPNGRATARVTRISKKPLTGEESYRVFVDQIPISSLRTAKSGIVTPGVNMVLRQIIPVFFRPGIGPASNNQQQQDLIFTAKAARGGFNITASNRGVNRIRISDVSLVANGSIIGSKGNLAGYALPGSAIQFFVPTQGGGMPNAIRFITDQGAMELPL
ncbi:fimbria/pilus periplasmic chaperone [Bartonella sp. HY329]|uniref:fimbrial biogenesis chaperone n=1 Tax=unclassified Bartonella TaxID=2645622 RepID=UPI0021C8BB82|nr:MULTISPECIES: fimbria/pilus periplasmic chaperone [unclassified Bartonella]UXM94732.1 fimbria/pilus periplasmic chaperone [Bartonella sp. HY329]UXN09055.1 fimbria/pilus periplasmic chaperone [Bartonella sp. HY328]